MAEKHWGKSLYRNTVSYFGGLIVAAAFILIIFSLILEFSIRQPSPYLGIFTYMVFPAILTFGALVFLYGMRRESLRRRKMAEPEALPYPRLDLNDPVQRKRFAYWSIGGMLGAILLGVLSYNAFLFTESVTFCGKVCHTIMQPEYTAYQYSPHARVACVDCHVGSGASWYVKSKMSGVRQVFAAVFHTYPTPIPVPIKNLRPARETCERCHWPKKFYGAQLVQIPHFRYDKDNTAEEISLLVKTGGGDTALGARAGIHWHMIIDNTVAFRAIDQHQEKIPWIQVKHDDGSVETFVDKDYKLTEKQIDALPKHTMDCIDCHNRPTHIFPAPGPGVDNAMAVGLIDPSLPWIKKVAVDALVKDYPSRAVARKDLEQTIADYYKKNYPDVYKTKLKAVEAAGKATANIYDRTVFPAMKVNWKTYAMNIGHRNWPGCFRCHDGRHVSTKTGKPLTHSCTACHTMPQRGPLVPLGTVMPASTENWHPWELKGKHAQILCSRCHAAGYRPPETCAGCHKIDPKAPMISMGCDTCHLKAQEVKPIVDCKSCHDDLGGLHLKGGHPDAQCWDCHKPHVWVVKGRATCETCHTDKKNHYKDQGACTNCHDFGTMNARLKLPVHAEREPLLKAHGA